MKEIYLRAFKKGLFFLEDKKVWINEINFFPVADKDTGDNIVKTIKEAIEIVEKDDSNINFFEKIADALFETATGNSGLIFSCFFDGFRKGINSEYLNSENLKKGFLKGKESSYEGIFNPKEGTILTVIRKMSDGIQNLEGDLIYILERAIEEGEKACDETRGILPENRKRGVPDAGALGFLIFWQGFFDEIKENFYEIVAILENSKIKEDIIISKLKNMGESLILNKRDRSIKIHIHTFLPDKIKNILLNSGKLKKIEISRVLGDR